MKEKKLIGERFPGPGISYIMPDKSWLTIPLNANGEKVREVQAQFWLEWAKYHHGRISSGHHEKSKQISKKLK